jgi:putative ABC transport system permease protein
MRWGWRRSEADFSQEIRAHLEAEMEALRSEGLTEDAARAAALRAFGNVVRAEERFYDSQRWLAWDHLVRETRYAVRTLRKNPTLVGVLVLCLGLGIGVNATIFGIFNKALLQGPTALNPGELVRVEPGNSDQISYANYRDLRGTPGFADFALSAGATLNLRSGDTLESLTALQVSANFFDLLGVDAFRGRTFTAHEAEPERQPRILVLDYGFWRRRFQEDEGIIGRALTLNGESFTVIGVLRRDHRPGMGLYVPDVYVPISRLVSSSLDDRRRAAFDLRARLAPGTAREQAQAAFTTAAQRLESAHPDTNQGFGQSAWVLPMSGLASLQGRGMPSEVPLLLAAPFVLFGFVLLIACANVAGVLIARGMSRHGEIAIRLALGASRASVARMLLVECLVLTMLSTIGGLILAWAVTSSLKQIRLPNALTLQLPAITPDFNLMVYAFAVAVVTCLFCGLLPAMQATRVPLTPGLRDTANRARRSNGRRVLVATQVAVSALLLTVCLTFVRSLQRVTDIDPGFDVRNGVTARLAGQPDRFTQQQLKAFAEQLVQRLEVLPQVEAVSFASLIPLGGDGVGRRAELRDVSSDEGFRVWVNDVGPRYFEAMGIPVRDGREFLTSDRVGSQSVVIVNEAFARRAYPKQVAIGRVVRIQTTDADPWREIVGVVADAKYASFSEAPQPQVYLPYLQTGGRLLIQVRTHALPALSLAPVRAAIVDFDPTVVVDVQTTEEATSLEFAIRRAATTLLAAVGGLGLLLSAVGLFGVLAWDVSRRQSEIGIRMALGASAGVVRRQVVGSALMLVGVGVAVGFAGAIGVTLPLRGFLVGVSPADPLTVAGVTILMLLTAALASVVPAHRASSIDPSVALRSE